MRTLKRKNKRTLSGVQLEKAETGSGAFADGTRLLIPVDCLE